MVLGRCPEEGDAADINLFYGGGEGAVGFGGLKDKGVEIADDQGDGGDGVGGQVGEIRRDISREDT